MPTIKTSAPVQRYEPTAAQKRTQYLRGIYASAPERVVDAGKCRHEMLDAAFSQVANTLNWKDPINAVITCHEDGPVATGVGVFLEAIEYFTATKPEMFIVSQELDAKGKQINTFRLVSEGYNLGPAGG